MGEYKLTQEIIALSDSKGWDNAKLEWALKEVYFANDAETCLCGHFPIIELCVITNKKNNKEATVGNCCVKKFIGLPSDKIFQAVKRIKKDNKKSLNTEAIEHAYKKGWINEWERNFYLDTCRKRKLTELQDAKRKQINDKVIRNMNKK